MSNTENITLNSPIIVLRGLGQKSSEKFQRLGIFTLNDLLFHLPYRYEDRTRIKSINQLQAGVSAVIEGEIEGVQVKMGRRKSLIVQIKDDTGFISLRFFHYAKNQQNSFVRGRFIQCYGDIRRGATGLEIVHPEYILNNDENKKLTQDHLTPVYHTTEGVHQSSIRKIMNQVMEVLNTDTTQFSDLLPPRFLDSLKLPSLKEAVFQLHQPLAETNTHELLNYKHPTQQRLIFEELLAHHLSLKELRNKVLVLNAPKFKLPCNLTNSFIKQLPFKLTGAQTDVITEISQNLNSTIPMLRLVQGDVGSGKTVVSMTAALQAVNSGWQVALMAPTETLSEQLYQNFSAWGKALNINVGWLTGKLKQSIRKTIHSDLMNGDIQILVGTHALFQEDVVYKKLGLVIIDEQHRFGVHQRLALKEKAYKNLIPHQLIMTATPIPRTLAMTAYADLDISIINELPKGRQHIDTVVMPDSRREQIIQRVNEVCKLGRQVYWVCPLIEESELLDAQAAQDTAEKLKESLPEQVIGLVHGRMKSAEKSDVIEKFKAKEINLLVATTVIEVGIDVPNASLMIIENAERLGLSQLHQLRGRVGRGSIKSSCVLMYNGKLSRVGHERLSIMRETNDGFIIAEKDLEIRGPGELLGTKQTGLLKLRVADITRDQYLFSQVEETAHKMFKECPENISPLIQRWLKHGLQYGNV